MNQYRRKNYKAVSILSGILIALFTLATISMLFNSNGLADILVGATGLVLFLTQIAIALTKYKRHYRDEERPVLSPRILRYRTKYRKFQFILLTDTVNTRLSSIVILMMIFYCQPFDLSWWIYLTTLIILVFTKIFIGRVVWERYGEFVPNNNVPVDQY
jgi:hypothetical protein